MDIFASLKKKKELEIKRTNISERENQLKNFNKVNFNEEYDIENIIEEMKNINETSNFHFERSKNPNEGYRFLNEDLLNSLPLEKDQHYPIHQLIEYSNFLISKMTSNLSSFNLLINNPLRDTEANILLDCTRTISNENKLFMLLITCSLTSVLNTLDIPFCIGLIGDSNFKIIIKPFEEPLSEEVLQRVMECIFISRYKTNLATCVKYAIDNFPHNFTNRVFYILSNGMDPELRKINRWKELIFNNKENSFSFIFIESSALKPKQKQYLVEQVWKPFREKTKNNISYVTSTEISINDIGKNDEFNSIDNLVKNISETLVRSDIDEKENNKMSISTFPQEFTNIINNINYEQDSKYFKALKEELTNIMVSSDALPFTNEEIQIDPSQERINPTAGKTEMYRKDLLKGQKILIVMCYTCELNNRENKRIQPYYINHSEVGEECIKTAIAHYGIEIDIVTNYKDAIDKLTHQEVIGYCDYYATWVMSGRPYKEMPNGADPGLVTQFIKVLNIFWKNGGSIVFCSDNQPFTFQTNLFLEQMVLPNGNKVSFRIGGNHPGEKILEADDTGLLKKKQTFNTKVLPLSKYERKSFANNLYQIYEGKTISFIGTGDLWNEKKFFAINDTNSLLPFVPFSRDSDGGINSIFYAGEEGYGDLVFDNSYTKFFLEMKECGTFRYVQNIAAWTAAPERSYVIDKIAPRDYRPKAVIYKITRERFTNFLEPPKSYFDFDLLFMIDSTGSMSGSLNMATKYCIDIWNQLKIKMPGIDFKIGGIFYRDPIDSIYDKNDYIDLTNNIESFKSFISEMLPYGGGDEPEDWVGAYTIALNNISWRNGIKCIIHIADAGAHGTKYSSGDTHPNEGPKLDLLIPQCAKKDFQIIAFNIGFQTINSFNVFKNIYDNNRGKQYIIKTFDQNNDILGYFTNLVIESVISCA